MRSPSRCWGTECLGGGRVSFRLWAPGEESLSLRSGGQDRPMQPAGDGWFETIAADIAPGSEYSFVLGDGFAVPDPASRAQAGDEHGPSLLVDPQAYRWRCADWRGKPWHEAVLYELHVGAFTPEGTFAAAAQKLKYLADLGVTAVEIMPVAQFAGSRGWGYDGVLLYAPHRAYGSPDDMRAFVDAAHAQGLMVLLDVVYNHFGPEGNYLPRYAPLFFHPEKHTPWGAAIAYERPPVRRFFIENALSWLREYRLDGLRFDAIDHIEDHESETEILMEIAQAVRAEDFGRPIHLTTEDARNITYLHERDAAGQVRLFTAEWNDDFHNAAHVVATGETEGYYTDFAERRVGRLARTLAEGFAYQGEVSRHRGAPRGHPSGHLPPTAFVDFLQNHDQVGNRAFGERLVDLAARDRVRALMAVLLLSPHIPLLFMGEEWGETRPFTFFTDFESELAEAVRQGRRREFAGFAAFAGGDTSEIPDPNAEATFAASKIDWERPGTEDGANWLALTRRLLAVRRERIMPLLAGADGHCGRILPSPEGTVDVEWRLAGAALRLRANLNDQPARLASAEGEVIHAWPAGAAEAFASDGEMPAHAVLATLWSETSGEDA